MNRVELLGRPHLDDVYLSVFSSSSYHDTADEVNMATAIIQLFTSNVSYVVTISALITSTDNLD